MAKKGGEEKTAKPLKGGAAKKAEAAAAKEAEAAAAKAQADANDWSVGVKSNDKKAAEAAKKAEAARKKAEKDAQLAEEEKELSKAKAKPSKGTTKKPTVSKGLDLSQLEDGADPTAAGEAPTADIALNATGIDNALDALDITAGTEVKIDKHPERRFKAAFAAFETKRLDEMDTDGSGQGLRQNQKREKIRKEFEKSAENPFNQVNAQYNASKEEMEKKKMEEKAKVEARLAGIPVSP